MALATWVGVPGATEAANPKSAKAEPVQEAPKKTACWGWWTGFGGLGWGKKVPPKEPPMKVSQPIRVESGTALRARAEASYLRRLEVCYKLMDIAIETQDEELERQVELMQERIWDAYAQRASQPPMAEVAAGRPRDDAIHTVGDSQRGERKKELER
jgi:hypothetical protein